MKLFCKWLIFSGSFFKRHVDAYADGVRPLKANFEPKENRFRFASYENSHTSGQPGVNCENSHTSAQKNFIIIFDHYF